MNRTVLWLIFWLFIPALSMASEPVSTADVLKKTIAAYAKLSDYICVLHRKEYINGSVKVQPDIRFKFMKPGSYSMRWDGDLIEKSVYVAGKNDNDMLVRGAGIFSFIRLAVDPDLALKYGRHTIIEADIGRILRIFEQTYDKARNDPDATIHYEREESVDGRQTWRYRVILPPGRGYYGHLININIDQALYLPIRIEVFGWNNEFLELYSYSDLTPNTGLSDADFDIRKPD